MRAKKSLGQHFLTNPRTAERIVDAVHNKHSVVEIGPGKGILTDLLVESCDRLVLIEKDDDLAGALAEEYRDVDRVEVINADFLKIDLQSILGEEQFSLVGNFPYNISSQIVFRMLDYKSQITEMVGMFQYEMARRVISGPGSKDYSVIGVLSQSAYRGQLVMKVGPGQFVPPPRVDSAVIRLERKEELALPFQYKSLRTIVKAAFAQRRKMLRNSLKSLIPREVIAADPVFMLRPEQITLEMFYDLAKCYESNKSSEQTSDNES